MKKRTGGIVCIVVGVLFALVNPIVFMVSLGFTGVRNLSDYWYAWQISGGWTMLLFVGIGLYLLFIGYQLIMSWQEQKLKAQVKISVGEK